MSTLKSEFTRMRAVIALCSKNGIRADRLMRFPRIVEQIPNVTTPGMSGHLLAEFHRFYDAREQIGFVILDTEWMKRLAAARIGHIAVQTPYIPPRIWVYQLNRLRACLDDFLNHREQLEACYRFCLNAYAENYGSLHAALDPNRDRRKAPFRTSQNTRTSHGSFAGTADRFGIASLLQRWLEVRSDRLLVTTLSAYLTLVSVAGLAYIANFTLQRREEAASLRVSCLVWEDDEKLGRVPLICGETTKTQPDSDARWVASPSVSIAIEAMTIIARLRMLCDMANPSRATTDADERDPFLFSTSSEPWVASNRKTYDIRAETSSLRQYLDIYPKLMDSDQLRVTREDLRIARRLTPNLPEDEFDVGKVWPLAWHQYRRTGAVNMFASGLISDTSMQQHMKHASRLMPLYYGRGYTRLRLNEHVETAVITAMYESMAAQLKSTMSERFVSPHSHERKEALLINLLSGKDTKTLVAWARSGKVTFREHRLGGCMKAGACEYGGVESIARCAGGDNGRPCTDVLFDRAKEKRIRQDLANARVEMSRLPLDSPRHNALLSECRAMENYLDVVEKS
ncbi:hypothetical protein [Burkholderia gladioli]|uniref:hypothetical protein n=1 Tax=Burkholderia gladioli TaxID=28095 RepID=UPI000FD92690|nr:hypothetical protein [Burkholderia gladioli]MBJ9716366.1 hypothetical protein [Burkholderia gladioli]MCH7273661.1 hypothetical protein [Burkholderia gladioli]MDC6127274.1 hypothetical protein [Burkholderia gladioli]MDN7499635.1 hypothetical protein [Burkholderia gladioli]MDR8086103.1 hypothetical protein [Burkholderia gladioli]